MPVLNIGEARSGSLLDRIGVVASCVCAMHCALMPALVGVLPLLGLSMLVDEQVEWMLIGLSVGVGVMSLLPAYFRHHGQARPLVIFVAGLVLVFVGRLLFEEDVRLEMAMVVAGALAIAAAHFVNRRLCRDCCAVFEN